jgi:dynein intermediate chain 3, axonemal
VGLQGCVAVACTEALSSSERIQASDTPVNHSVLVWNFRDPIHPEFLLEAPFEVFCFQSNPAAPDLLAGGLYSGQVCTWDISGAEVHH